MKQILSYDKTLIVSENESLVIDHPTTVFTDDDVIVSLFTDTLTSTGLKQKQVDNTLIHCAESDILIPVIHLEDEPRTTNSDEAVGILTGKGTIIITNQ